MTSIWFNKTFSLIHVAMNLIRMGDIERKYTLIHTSSNPYAVGKLACDKWDVEPKGISGVEYVEWCLSFCRNEGINIFIPGKEASLIYTYADDFLALGTRILAAATPSVIKLLNDKLRFSEAIMDMAVPAVEFVSFSDQSSFESAYSNMRKLHPTLCIKPAQSVYGIGFKRIVEDRSAIDIILGGDPYSIDLTSFTRALAEGSLNKTMLLMPYLTGPEFSVDCVAHQGQTLCAVTRRKSNQSGVGQTIDSRQDIQDSCKELIKRFCLNGNINIQFREGRNGLRVLEINPRMSGGIGMACEAGINLPYLALSTFDDGISGREFPVPRHDTMVSEVNTPVRLS